MPQTQSPAKARTLDQRLLALDVRAIWHATRAAPWSMWFLCLYMMFEYNRIQQIYPALAGVPWATLMIVACFAAMLVEGAKPRRTYGMDWFVGAFFLWVVISGVLALEPALAWRGWSIAASWVLMYYLVTRIVVTPRRLLLFWLAFFLVHLKMSQAGTRSFVGRGFTFTDYGVMGGPGWFSNSGEFAMEMVAIVGMTLSFLLALRGRMPKRRLNLLIAVLTGTAFISVIASSSRGGQLALAVMLTVMYVFTAKVRPRTLLIGVTTVVIGWTLLPAEQKARFTTMGEDNTSQLRLTAWRHARAATMEYPVTGVGYENWQVYFGNAIGSVREIHNTTLEASAELGFPGAFFFFGAIATSFFMNSRTRRRARRHGEWAAVYRGMALGLDMAMIGLVVASQFMSVLFFPSFWMAFALTTALAETVRRAEVDTGRGRARTRMPQVRAPSQVRRPTAAVHRGAVPPSTVRFQPR